jgi:succinate dehydrogenase/fumarate reductase flavoprotein subunit
MTTTDWLGSAPDIAEADIAEEWTSDLLIIGAGNAGMTAATKAAELGLDFRLIDKGLGPSTPRNAVGGINDSAAIAADFTEDPFHLLKELTRYSSGKCNADVVKVWLNESGTMINWAADILADYDFEVIFTADRGIEQDPFYYCAATEHRFAAKKDSRFPDMNRHSAFLDYIGTKGYSPDFGVALVKFEQDATGAITGAIAQKVDSKEYVRIKATDTILSTGGYADNPEMMLQIAPLASQTIAAFMLYPGNDGLGIRAAMWAGADKDVEPTPMLFDRGAVPPGTEVGIKKTADGYEVPAGYIVTTQEYNPATQPFLKVNRLGNRFANEMGPYTDMIWAGQNQPGHTWCQIYDADYDKDWQTFHTLGCSSLARARSDNFIAMIDDYVEQGIIMKADTLEELATKLGFGDESARTFLATVDRYNELYDAGEDSDYGKPVYRLSDIRNPPFYGVWLGSCLLTTEDGIKINENCQALDKNAEVIKGLYVAGDCSGSFFANNYPYLFPGNACGKSMLQGWKSVKVIAGVE